MFAALTLERDPLKAQDLLGGLVSWAQDAGGFAAAGLTIWILAYLLTPRPAARPGPRPFWHYLFILAVAAAALNYAFVGLIQLLGLNRALLAALLSPVRVCLAFGLACALLWYLIAAVLPGVQMRRSAPVQLAFMAGAGVAGAALALGFLALFLGPGFVRGDKLDPLWLQAGAYQAFLAFGGACALFAAVLPVLASLPGISPRRIWALARLSFKEAIRRRVLWAFSALLLVFLFAGWFIDSKPEDQVRTYVGVVSRVMALLLLVTAGLLASFSIPTDIRNQTIHTILTKPVERFEVVLGRFLGYTLLMTLVLGAATALSLLYVMRGVEVEAAEESLKARVPLFGELFFAEDQGGRLIKKEGESVGREWDYRRYVPGPNPPNPVQYAVWDIASLPRKLADRDTVRCEFTFDIFRTTKGADDTPVACTFVFETWRFRGRQADYNEERKKAAQSANPEPRAALDARLAEEYGYYEATVPVVDYHTRSIDIPAGLFRNALQADDSLRREMEAAGQEIVPLRVRVRCVSRTQYVGMAKYDLYLRADDHEAGADQRWFSWNFFKGAVGLWFRLCLVIGLAVALSTYLSGVISLLCVAFLYLAGFFQGFIQDLARGTNFGGGPMESMLRLFKGQNLVAPLEDTAAARVAAGSDVAFRWVLRRLLNVLPDVDLFGLSNYVAEGFDVSATQLALRLVFLIGYLVPWAVLAYYMIQAREVASST